MVMLTGITKLSEDSFFITQAFVTPDGERKSQAFPYPMSKIRLDAWLGCRDLMGMGIFFVTDEINNLELGKTLKLFLKY